MDFLIDQRHGSYRVVFYIKVAKSKKIFGSRGCFLLGIIV